jgi:Protein of unknown function (DUF3108)
MLNKIITSLLYLVASCAITQGQCVPNKIGFAPGEKINYEVYYHWGMIWANAGDAEFAVEKDVFAGKPVYHLIGGGSSKKNWDWFFKVRDRFDSWVDMEQLKPLRYIRKTTEGGNVTHNDSYFYQGTKKIHVHNYSNPKAKTYDTLSITPCLFDVMTMIYYARTLDFSNAQIGYTLPYSMYLDGKIYPDLNIKYLGKEKITCVLGDVNCIKFSPKLIPGTIFKAGQGMIVWVTDDDLHLPVKIETPIVVGEVLIKLKTFKKGL